MNIYPICILSKKHFRKVYRITVTLRFSQASLIIEEKWSTVLVKKGRNRFQKYMTKMIKNTYLVYEINKKSFFFGRSDTFCSNCGRYILVGKMEIVYNIYCFSLQHISWSLRKLHMSPDKNKHLYVTLMICLKKTTINQQLYTIS